MKCVEKSRKSWQAGIFVREWKNWKVSAYRIADKLKYDHAESVHSPVKSFRALFVRSWLTWLIADQSSMKYIFTWCCCRKCREIEPAFSQQHITLLKEHLIWRINCCYYVINEIVVKIDSFTMYCSYLQNVYSTITLFFDYFYNKRVKIEWRQFSHLFRRHIQA